MRLRLTFLLLAITFPVGMTASAQDKTGSAQKQPASAESDIRSTLERLYAAWSDLDPAKTAPFYAKDPDLPFFDVAPMQYRGWSEYAAGVPGAFVDYRSGKFTLNDDLRIHRQGKLAWVTATWRAALTRKDGATEHLEGRYTGVLEKRGKQWLIIHEHMSVPLGGEQKK